eukprot:TRINITY_DN5699_c0_g1_i1.p1 TRINITY_DN5699_c0_g1~~TRINITY_DN5699_c0_g1_i1.p1  ORF type:complete len:326 (-),score=80.10 TRINITY_DN5699_c0_g1_i1:207-1064(-)
METKHRSVGQDIENKPDHIRMPPHTAAEKVHSDGEKPHKKSSDSLFWWLPKELQLVLCTCGVYLFYLGLGGYQEKLLTAKYGPDGATFPSVFFLLACMCVGNAAVSFLQILLFKPSNNCPFTNFAQIAIPYLGGMVCSYSSVAYLDFPTQVLAKSCKPIPVMFMGVFILRRKYPLKKYFFVILISFGVALFSLANPKSKENTTTTLEGIGLLLLSLMFDSFTGPLQERLLAAHAPSPAHLMLHTNVWATIFCFVGLTISGQLPSLINFLGTHPEVLFRFGFTLFV